MLNGWDKLLPRDKILGNGVQRLGVAGPSGKFFRENDKNEERESCGKRCLLQARFPSTSGTGAMSIGLYGNVATA